MPITKKIVFRLRASAPYLMVATLLLVFNPTAILRPEFWAEDGVNFFKDAFELGKGSLFLPLGHYQNVIPRLVALVATYFPIRWIPAFFAGFAWISSSVCLGYFARNSFRAVIKSDRLRLVVCCLFAVAPGAIEVTQAICNLHTVFSLFAVLLVLEQPFRMTILKWSVFFLISFSCPEMPIVGPLLFYLAWKEKRPVFVGLFMLVTSGFIFNFLSSARGYPIDLNQMATVPRIVVQRFVLHSLILPFLGPKFGGIIFHANKVAFTLLAAGWLGLIAVGIKKVGWGEKKLLIPLLLFLAAAGYFGLLAVGRSWSELARPQGSTFWGSRYGFVAIGLSLVAWVSLLEYWAENKKNRSVPVAYAGIVVIVVHLMLSPPVTFLRPKNDWPVKAREISAAIGLKNSGQLKSDVEISGIKIQPNNYSQFGIRIPKATAPH